MAQSVLCPNCGSPLPPDAPAGVCPKCLVQAGFESAAPNPSLAATTPASPAATGFVPPEPAELARHFPQLEILELLGRGGMGAVYKARQPGLDRIVALKILPAEAGRDPAFAERFAREARALAKLNHPQIVTIYDFGQSGGLFYFLMEFVDGVNLRQAMRAGQIKPEQALAIVPQVCEALQFAHDEGVVHRDIKPENILLDKRGRVKIADFGLSKLLAHDGQDNTLTGTHQVMGTIRYMAPEQMEGTHAVDHRADIYSLGVVFYELLTGEVPLGRFDPPSHKVQVDIRLDEVVLRSLAREPEKRYQHASDVKTEVDLIRQSSAVIPAQLASGIDSATLADAKPAEPPPRPWYVPVLGVINILTGLLLMMFLVVTLVPEDPNSAFEAAWKRAQERLPGYAILTRLDKAFVFLEYLAAALLFAAGLGLLLGKPWGRRVAIGVCIFSLVDLVINIPGIVLQGIAPGFMIHNDPVFLTAEGITSSEAATLCGLFVMMFSGVVLVALTYPIVQLVILNRPAVKSAFDGAEVVTNSPSGANLAAATHRISFPLRIASQMMPRDATDFVHAAALMPAVIPLVFMIPGFLTYLIALAIGRTPLDAMQIGMFTGLALTIGLFLVLGVGSMQSATLDESGVTLHRFAGPSKFLAWSEVTRIRLMARWDVVRQVWIWPGLPPRGSIINGTTKDYYAFDTRDGCWYFCPGDLPLFLATVKRIETATRRTLLVNDPATAASRAGVGGVLFASGIFTLVVPVLVAFWLWLGGIPFNIFWQPGPAIAAPFLEVPKSPGQVIKWGRHQGIARDLAVSSDGQYLVSVGDDGLVATYNVITGWRTTRGIYGNLADKTTLGLRSVAIDKQGQNAYVVGNPRSPAIHKAPLVGVSYEGIPFRTAATTNKIAWWGGGDKLACIVGDTDYAVVELVGKQTAGARIYPGKAFGNVRAAAASANGTYMAVTSSNMVADGQASMISAEPAQLSVFDITAREVLTWQFADYADFSYAQPAWIDDRTLLLAIPSGQLLRWNLNPAGTEWQPAEPVRIAPGRYLAAAPSADRRAIWLATDRQVGAVDYLTGQTVAWADIDPGQKLGQFAAEPIEAIVAIPHTNLVAAALWNGQVVVVYPHVEPK